MKSHLGDLMTTLVQSEGELHHDAEVNTVSGVDGGGAGSALNMKMSGLRTQVKGSSGSFCGREAESPQKTGVLSRSGTWR
ncbi:hypothetical protein AHiyo8_26350 [Arthrobacter sp. Hiyo8]|nr:hypothetical protein AHiyo8_26350 [Arthrobacter sp. Hiyo8]